MKKKGIIATIIIVVIAIAVSIALVFNKTQKSAKKDAEDTQQVNITTLPQLSVYYKDGQIADVKGYTMEMQGQYVRDSIIPVAPDRKVPIQIKPNKNEIKTISYEVRSTEDNRLIDNGDIKDWSEDKGIISLTYAVSAIMNTGAEYELQINIATDNYSEIHYYTRVMVMDKEFVQAQMKFAEEFSDKTFDSAKSSDLAIYMEPDLNAANDNMGKITLKSSYTMLIWNTLKPTKIGSTQITAKEICIKDTGEAGTYTMNYQIEATNAQKVKETYNVAETISVWTCAGKQYVLAYERDINQIWQANKTNVGNAFIDLGIQNTTEIEHVESSNGKYIAYAINGDIYLMEVTAKKVTPIYKLNAKSADALDKTGAKVIKVDDKGNVDFMIYGYSPSGQHIGKNGVSVIDYNYKNNASKEVAFIPIPQPASILKEQLSQLCYVGDGALYIMLDSNIYYANLKTKEWGTLVNNLEEGSYAINDAKTVVAYNTNGTAKNSDSITIVNLVTGKKSTISAGDGNKISVCGYTGGNLVYGIAGSVKPSSKMNFFPINKLLILDEKLKEIKAYSKPNVYVKEVQITDTTINIKRWEKGKDIEDDQLLDNTESKESVASASYYNDDVKQRELALAFTNNLDSGTKLEVLKLASIEFSNKLEVNSKLEKTKDANYYVYAYGKLQGVYIEKRMAINAAKTNSGLVVDGNNQKIWTFEEHYK